jgi:hypothetical protein
VGPEWVRSILHFSLLLQLVEEEATPLLTVLGLVAVAPMPIGDHNDTSPTGPYDHLSGE